jgi:hypothetical protein
MVIGMLLGLVTVPQVQLESPVFGLQLCKQASHFFLLVVSVLDFRVAARVLRDHVNFCSWIVSFSSNFCKRSHYLRPGFHSLRLFANFVLVSGAALLSVHFLKIPP